MNNESIFGQIRQSNNPDGEHFIFTGGLTLRDYFAGQALNAMMSQSITPPDATMIRRAYGIADTMIKERSK